MIAVLVGLVIVLLTAVILIWPAAVTSAVIIAVLICVGIVAVFERSA